LLYIFERNYICYIVGVINFWKKLYL